MRFHFRARVLPFLFASLVSLSVAGADSEKVQLTGDLRLPDLFTDNMVFQQNAPARIWGWGEPGHLVKAKFANDAAMTIVRKDGTWALELNPPRAGGPYTVEVIGDEKVTLRNVLVGEVWLASGQSNMQWTVAGSQNPDAEIAAADYPTIRLFTVGRIIREDPHSAFSKTGWEICSPETVKDFSAVAYYFGRRLKEDLGVPIGLISSNWGGTRAEAWTSPEALRTHPDYASLWAKGAEGPEALLEEMKHHTPAILFHSMLKPLIPYSMRGVIWYQGESNAGRAHQYQTLFPLMINDWRNHWDLGDFPFLFVQLANFRARAEQPGPSEWAELREAQTMALSLPNTGMAVTIDIGAADDIHPKNKQDVGKRLALAARHVAYGNDLVYSGPAYRSMDKENGQIRIHFDHIADGLVSRGGELEGFAIAGKDQNFVWANAKIDGDTVVVSNPDIPNPVAVRYAWADNPAATLYNTAGLPAVPFRTDDWPGVTVGKK